MMSTPPPFEQRSCFIAGPAKSGTTLLAALLDGHPEMLVLPEETAYFPTVLAKYAKRGRRAQFDYLTQQTLSNVLFGAECKWGKRDYSHFPRAALLAEFARHAFDPAQVQRDLLVILLESYAAVMGRPLESVRYWVEKTPANRDYLGAIFERFPHTKVLLTIRDPRALLATQIQLERTRKLRRFSIYLTIKHWRTAARIALQQQASSGGDERLMVVGFRRLLKSPDVWLRKVCAFLGIAFSEELLTPTKVGKLWLGNSVAEQTFAEISTEPADRWMKVLSQDEIGWVEWHCREWMEPLGYKPVLAQRKLRHWARPVRGETPKEYAKSRLYSWGKWQRT